MDDNNQRLKAGNDSSGIENPDHDTLNTGDATAVENDPSDNQNLTESHADRLNIEVGDITNTDMMLPTKEANNEEVKASAVKTESIISEFLMTLNIPVLLCKHDKTYKLETFLFKIMIIFNNVNIEGYSPRRGTWKDVDALKSAYETLGFKVFIYTDKTKDEIMAIMRAFGDKDFTNYGAIFVSILTHGKKNRLLGSDGECYSVNDILNCLDVKENFTLATKPIVLLIQACRGKVPAAGVPVKLSRQLNQKNVRHAEGYPVTVKTSTPAQQQEEDSDNDVFYYISKKANILIVYSCSEEETAARHPEQGSWFIQSLCRNINNMADTCHFLDIVLETQSEIGLEMDEDHFNSTTISVDTIKQTPVYKSTLCRKLYFKNYEEQPPLHFQTIQCPCDFIRIFLSLAQWMLFMEVFFEEDVLNDDILALQAQLQNYKQVQENIILTAPEILKRSKKDGMVKIILNNLHKIKRQLSVGESSDEEEIQRCDDDEKLEKMMNTVIQLIATRLDLLESAFTVLLNLN